MLVTTITLYVFIIGTNKKDESQNKNNVKGMCVCVFILKGCITNVFVGIVI